MRNILFFLFFLFYSLSSLGQNFAIIGNGTTSNTNTGYPSPFGNWYWGSRHQFFITAAQMNAAGITANSQISSLGFNVTATNGATSHQNFTIRIFTTTLTNPISTGWVTTNQVSQTTAVNHTPVVGWNQFTLQTPFIWNGTTNLVVEVCFNNTSYSYNASTQWTTSGLGVGTWSRWFRSDVTGVCTNTSLTSTSSTTRPNMRFEWSSPTSPTPPSCSGSPSPANSVTGVSVGTTLTWSSIAGATGYDVYFGTSPTPPLVSTNQPGTTYTPVTLNVTTLYYWRIVPRNSVGTATGCPTWSFTTGTPGCTNGVQYTSYTPLCNGTQESYAGCTYAGEYNNLTLVGGTAYTFGSSITTDFITITNSTGTILASGTQPINYTPTSSGTYRVYVHTNSSCGTSNTCRNPWVQCGSILTSPTSITASATTICAGVGTNVTLTANGTSGTAHWFVGLCGTTGSFATGNSTVVTPSVTTTYYVRNFNGTAWSTNCASITIVVNNPPTGILSNASPTTICNGQQTNLTSSATYTSTIHQVQNETDFLEFITNDSKWSYDFTSNSGGTSPELFFDWFPDATGLFWTQFGSMINATGYTNLNFQFKHFLDDFSGGYTLRLQTSPNGIIWTDRWLLSPSGNVGPATVNVPLTVLDNSSFFYRFVFDGNSFNIDGWWIDDIIITGTPPVISYNWTSSPSGFSSNLQNTTVNPNVTTNYTVTATANGCSSSSNINVTVNPIPSSPITTNDNICYGATGFPSANTSVNWYTLPTGGTFLGTTQTYTTPSLIATTTYYVEANVNGCISSRVPVTVNVNPFPNSVSPTTTTATGCNIVDPNNWVYLVDPSNTIVAAVNDPTGNNPMGQTAASVTILPTVQTFNGKPYIQRVVSINPTNNNVPVIVRLYYTITEFQNLQAVDPFLTSHLQLGVTKFDGPGLTGNSVYIQPSQWLIPGQTGIPNVYALVFNVSNFSTFAIHPNNNNTPLPIKLINFDVENKKNYVDINWSTAVEINNDFFTVERSSEGENFEEVMKVKGAGNSNEIIYYSEVDYKPLKGQSYYRLKQTDFDGTSTYSEIKAVYIDNKFQDNGAIVYPNPMRGENFQVKIITHEEEEVSIEIFDNSGKKLKSTSFTSKIGINESQQNVNRLGSGIYTVKITGEISGVSFHKLIISN